MEHPFEPELILEERGPVRIVTLNRPEAMNAANEALSAALLGVWDFLASDPEARAVVLTGAGRAFSAGGDMEHFLEIHEDLELRQSELDGAGNLLKAMVSCKLPIIAAVNGPAVGLGCNLAVVSDLVLIEESTFLCDPHVSVGLTAADGGAPCWPMYVSLLKAKEYLFTGARIPAATAVELGLANRVVPDGTVVEAAIELAQQIAAQPKQALQSTKRALNIHMERAMSGVLEYALSEEFRSYSTPEHQAIVHTFLAKD